MKREESKDLQAPVKSQLYDVGEQDYEVKELHSKMETDAQESIKNLNTMTAEEIENILKLKEETVLQAKQLQQKEQAKLHELMNLMISIQMEKLEFKLAYIAEYEKLIMYEKRSLEFQQRMCLIDRL